MAMLTHTGTADWQQPTLSTYTRTPLVVGPGAPVYLDAPARADCRTCGAPDQPVGERCRYCVHTVTRP